MQLVRGWCPQNDYKSNPFVCKRHSTPIVKSSENILAGPTSSNEQNANHFSQDSGSLRSPTPPLEPSHEPHVPSQTHRRGTLRVYIRPSLRRSTRCGCYHVACTHSRNCVQPICPVRGPVSWQRCWRLCFNQSGVLRVDSSPASRPAAPQAQASAALLPRWPRRPSHRCTPCQPRAGQWGRHSLRCVD
jgi:hypothetical protein